MHSCRRWHAGPGARRRMRRGTCCSVPSTWPPSSSCAARQRTQSWSRCMQRSFVRCHWHQGGYRAATLEYIRALSDVQLCREGVHVCDAALAHFPADVELHLVLCDLHSHLEDWPAVIATATAALSIAERSYDTINIHPADGTQRGPVHAGCGQPGARGLGLSSQREAGGLCRCDAAAEILPRPECAFEEQLEWQNVEPPFSMRSSTRNCSTKTL